MWIVQCGKLSPLRPLSTPISVNLVQTTHCWQNCSGSSCRCLHIINSRRIASRPANRRFHALIQHRPPVNLFPKTRSAVLVYIVVCMPIYKEFLLIDYPKHKSRLCSKKVYFPASFTSDRDEDRPKHHYCGNSCRAYCVCCRARTVLLWRRFWCWKLSLS